MNKRDSVAVPPGDVAQRVGSDPIRATTEERIHGDDTRADLYQEHQDISAASSSQSNTNAVGHSAGEGISVEQAQAGSQPVEVAGVRELPVTAQNYINTNLDQAFPLCIVLTNEKTLPWIYESYVQLFSTRLFRKNVAGFRELTNADETEEPGVADITLGFQARPLSEWLKAAYIKEFLGAEPEDIIAFIIRSINLGCYLRIEVDEFYLPNKKPYGLRQFIHPILIYGYDNNSGIVMGIGFDAQGFFTKLSFKFEDFRRAYQSSVSVVEAKLNGRPLVMLFKFRVVRDTYPFSLERFTGELDDYLRSKKNSKESYHLLKFLPPGTEESGNVKWGFGVYEHLDDGLKNQLAGKNSIHYKEFHLLFEHKRVISDAVKFIISEFKVRGKLVELSEDFEKVAHAFHSMRWKYFRFQYTHNTRLIEEIVETLDVARRDEHDILSRMYEQLQSRL
jgi:hypothetical protein